MDLQQYTHALRAYWWAIVLPVLLALGLGIAMTARAQPQYRASLTFFVGTSGGEGAPSAAAQSDAFAQSRVNSYVELLRTDRLARQIVAATGPGLSPGQVRRMLGAHADVDTVLLTATVTSPSKADVTRVAGVLSGQLVSLVDQLEQRPGAPPAVHLELVSGPSVGAVPPRKALTVGVPVALGLLVGLALAWLLELRDKRIRTEAELRRIGAGPVLGLVPADRRLRDGARGREVSAGSAGMESFRQVRTNLEFLDVSRPVRVLVVTSAAAEEGKTTTTVNLARVFAAAGRNVLVLEADLRQPTVAVQLGAAEQAGLTDLLVGRVDLDDALQPVHPERLTVLPSGPLPPNPSELLGSDAMVDLLAELRSRFDIVVVNTPPLLPVTDAAVLAAHADGVLLVVRAGRTTRQQVGQATRSLHAVGARLLGSVLNMAPGHRGSGYTAYWRTASAAPPAAHARRKPERPPDDEGTPGGDADGTAPDADGTAPAGAGEAPAGDVSAPAGEVDTPAGAGDTPAGAGTEVAAGNGDAGAGTRPEAGPAAGAEPGGQRVTPSAS